MSDSKQRRERRELEEMRIRAYLDVGDDIRSMRTLRLLERLVRECTELKQQLDETKDRTSQLEEKVADHLGNLL